MAGLPTKSDSALQQWHHLFESRGDVRSLQAQQHWQQLMRVGLPTRKHENWKYTPLDTLLSQQFVLPDAPQTLSAEQVDALALPLDAINAACAREKSIRHGHPSTLHLWWARRPLAAARAVIFAQLVNDPGYQQGGGFKYGKNK